ncbi:MAG: O-antigen ligase family protein [Kiritimatiellae bacterium]|nr:O-antigen ligase family protein [Kiritimatiellia bacterium]
MIVSLENYKTKLYQCFFGFGFIGFALTAIRRIVTSGNSHHLYVVVVFTLLFALILGLDRYYWVLGCYLIFTIGIPYIKTSGLELGGGTLVCMYFLRSIFRREIPAKPEFPTFWILIPYIACVAVMFVINPCGLFIFGAQSIGSRFYAMLVIGLAVLFVLERMTFTEQQAKVLFYTAMAGSLSCLVFVSRAADSVISGDAFSDSLHYEFLQMRIVAMLLLCRYPISRFLSDFRLFLCIATAWTLCVYSGNRTAGMTPPVCAAILAFVRRRERMLVVLLAAVGMFGLVFLAVGHGNLYQLPTSVQKALSFLPGDWDAKWSDYGFKDRFRAELRRMAKDQIRQSPWTGRKGFAINLGEVSWVAAGNDAYAGHALTGNWHNVWLGLAADFGVPCAMFFALFYACAIIYAYRKTRIFRPGSWLESMYLFVFIQLFLVFLNSFFAGGHSAKTPEETFLWFGFCLALINGREAELRSEPTLIHMVSANSNGEH